MEFNLAQVFSAVAAANPDRDCIVFGHRRFTFSQTDERARRLARALHAWGLGAHRERRELAAHESGQSHLGLYMANCNEFLEGMLGAYQARVAPFNVNYRYVADELIYLLDNAGAASESGAQMIQASSRQQGASGRFAPNPGAVVVSEDMTRILSPGDDEIGWLAQQGLIPLGYLGDAEKTARTFPVIDGIRHSVPGDRARWFADGEIELLGRDSVTINSGGEKIFAEEVEAAIAEHPAVYDVVVTSRPSPRWGNEVVAIVALADGAQADPDSIIAEAARHLARYKLPKAVVFRDRLERSPSGKADYRWAKAQVAQDN